MKAAKVVSIAPFRLNVRRSKRNGFTMVFRGTPKGASAPAAQEVTLEFPAWWAGEIVSKLDRKNDA